jgi:general secretion pathway protein D
VIEKNMENIAMRKILLLLLVGGLCVTNRVWSDGPTTNKSTAAAATSAAPRAPVPAHALTPKVESLAQQAAQEEIVRRQEAQITARQLIDQGVKLHSAAKYADAIVKFEDALKILPRAKATEADYARAIHGISDSYYRLADNAEKNDEHGKAKQLAQKALEYDPQNAPAENLIVRIMAEERRAAEPPPKPIEIGLDETPAFLQRRNQIKKLFREGKVLMGSGQFDEAEKRFQQILLLDAYNDDAHTLLEKLNTARLGFATQAADKSRTERLWDVTREWVQPIASRVEPPRPGSTTPVAAESAALAKTKEKLNRIVLPEVSFRDATITDVIKLFVDESRRLDEPTKEGVNFVLQSDQIGGSNAPAHLVSLNLHNIPLIEALGYATSGSGLEFRIERNAVLVGVGLSQAGQMVTRPYPVSGEAFRTTLIGGANPNANASGSGAVGTLTKMGGEGGTATLTDVRLFFENAGVPFPPGSSLVYNERSSVIIIRNTTENLETFERVLASINVVPMQVEVEAKFVEISQGDLDELSFQWTVGRKTAGSFDVGGGSPPLVWPPDATPSSNPNVTQGLRDSTSMASSALDVLMGAATTSSSVNNLATIRGILTDPQFQLVVKALAQKKSADILSAPKITTISGSAAQVKVVQEFIYPTTYSQAQVTSSGGGTSGGGAAAVTPAIPSGFNTREIGVLLNVTPTIGADGYTINLTLIPEVSEFLGFINYGSPIGYAVGNSTTTVPNDIKEPLFETRTLTTSVVIWDGQTVVLGGLIKEQTEKIDDKVPFLGDIPFLGRLFRSKVSSRSKRNLLIFVTANLIDPAGNKIHRQTTGDEIPG